MAGRGGRDNAQATATTHEIGERGTNSTLRTGTVQEGFPTPASLAEIMRSTRQMLIEHAGGCLLVCFHVTLYLYILKLNILVSHNFCKVWRWLS